MDFPALGSFDGIRQNNAYQKRRGNSVNIYFQAPIWLIFLLPTWILCVSKRKITKLRNIAALLFFTCLVLAMSKPAIKSRFGGGKILVVAADVSASMPADAQERQIEIIRLLEKEKGKNDKIAVISFAEKSFIEQIPSSFPLDGFKGLFDKTASDMTGAIKMALSLIPEKTPGKILLIGDGLSTGLDPLRAIEGDLRGIPIDFRMLSRAAAGGNDPAILSFDMPSSAEKGEAFRISAEISVPPGTDELKYALLKNSSQILSSGILRFSQSSQTNRTLIFFDKNDLPGFAGYRLVIYPEKADPVPENNTAENIVSVEGSGKILHIGNPNSRLLKIAAENAVEIQNMDTDSINLSLSTLGAFESVVLENVSANRLGYAGQETLKSFVLDIGGGFMMTGGRNSFGVGGYFRSPLEEILPLTMEIRKEHKKFTSAVVVALDRSGSMTMSVPGGLQKMDLANRGTASILELLTDNDMLGVIAVDSQAHIIHDISKIAGKKNLIRNRILSIKSMGGGIFIFEALAHAAKMISQSSAATKHIVLFADAADSEEPGDYRKLLARLRESGITVSVIGLGSERDCDANLLKEIASLGGGNMFFSNEPRELPQLFTQDLITVFKTAFCEEEIKIAPASDLPLIAEIPESHPPPLGGYNICFQKPEALLALCADDENKTPILAFMETGAGRSLAFTGEVDGKFTGHFGHWKESGQLLMSCMRWTKKSAEERDSFFVKMRREGSEISLSLELDPDRKTDPFSKTPELMLLTEDKNGISKKRIAMRWNDADSLSAAAPIPAAGTTYYYISYSDIKGKNKILRGGAYRMPYPAEFRTEKDSSRGRKLLERLAKISGGQERIAMDGIFEKISSPTEKPLDLRPILVILALIFLISEIVFKRFAPDAEIKGKIIIGAFIKIQKINSKLNAFLSFSKESSHTQELSHFSEKNKENGGLMEKNELAVSADQTFSQEKKPDATESETAINKAKKKIKKRFKQ
jgi:Mg-chelatase subunit ChlD